MWGSSVASGSRWQSPGGPARDWSYNGIHTTFFLLAEIICCQKLCPKMQAGVTQRNRRLKTRRRWWEPTVDCQHVGHDVGIETASTRSGELWLCVRLGTSRGALMKRHIYMWFSVESNHQVTSRTHLCYWKSYLRYWGPYTECWMSCRYEKQ